MSTRDSICGCAISRAAILRDLALVDANLARPDLASRRHKNLKEADALYRAALQERRNRLLAMLAEDKSREKGA